MLDEKNIPSLEPSTRSREYKSYASYLRDRVIFEYLFNAVSHRSLDEIVLGHDREESRGYQSMGILHYLGLKGKHKGLFKGYDVKSAIKLLKETGVSDFTLIIEALERYENECNNPDTISYFDIDDDEREYLEGEEAYRLHKYRERDPRLIRDAKAAFLRKYGALFCEVCNLNFVELYGNRGRGYIEAHHTKPISEMKDGEVTKIEDIAMLCSNCHRMIHRKPFISVEELRRIVNR